MENNQTVVSLSGAAVDVLYQLAAKPRWDGNLSSKCGRSELVEKGLAFQVNGFNFITSEGARYFERIHGLSKVIGN